MNLYCEMHGPQEKRRNFQKKVGICNKRRLPNRNSFAVRGRLTCLQSTSSIFDASSSAPSTSSSGVRSSSPASSSSSMLRPSLIMRWMRPANWVGSSRLKPEVRSEVSNSSQIRSFTVLSDLSAAAFFLSSDMIECFGLTSMVFLDTMYEVMELSRNACAFMIRSMFADQPYSEVVRTPH